MPNHAVIFTSQPLWIEDVLNEGQETLKPNADMSLEFKLDHRKYDYSLMSQILLNHGCSLVENRKPIYQLQ